MVLLKTSDRSTPFKQPLDEDEESATYTGTFVSDKGQYGFIKQDTQNEDVLAERIFVLPFSCPEGKLPTEGSRVEYKMVMDPKTKRPRAEDVVLEGAAVQSSPAVEVGDEFDSPSDHRDWYRPEEKPSSCSRRDLSILEGSLVDSKGNYGFVKTEDEEIFVHETHCPGRKMPEVGTRLRFEVDLDQTKNWKKFCKNVSIVKASVKGVPEPSFAKSSYQTSARRPEAKVQRPRGRSYKSDEMARLWEEYCDEFGNGQHDPEEHSASFLRGFVQAVLPGPHDMLTPAAKRQRT